MIDSRQNKPWYKYWWGIILVIPIWPLFLIWLTWSKAKWSIPIKVGASVVLGLCIFICAAFYTGVYAGLTQNTPSTSTASATSVTKNNPTPTKTTAAKPVTPAPAPKPSPTPTPAQQPTQPNTLDLLWKALDNSGQSRDSVHISFQDASQMYADYGGLATFTKDDLNPWDSNSFVQNAISSFVKYGQQAFKISGVDHLDFIVNSSFIDDHGNSSTDIGFEIKMSKTNFDSFNWKNLEGTPVYDTIVNSSEYDHLAYAIRKNVDTSKVILVLN